MTKTTEARLVAANNLRHWDMLKATDPKHTKGFTRAGGFKGTALKPIWIVQQLTKQFGPVGEGWGMGKPDFQIVDLTRDTGRVMVYCTIECWHTDRANTFYGVGGDTVQDQFKNGSMVPDDEAFKKAYTDAVNNAFKFVGVGADIHMGQFEDSKYLRDVAEYFAPRLPEEDKLEEFIAAVAQAATDDDLKALLDKYKSDIDKVGKEKPAEKARAVQAFKARSIEIQPAPAADTAE